MSDSGQLHARKLQFAKVPSVLIHDKRVTPGAVRCYAHMHWRYGRSHKNFEGQESIARYLGVSERAVSGYIKELEAYGWVVVVERDYNAKTGHYQTPFYHIFESRKEGHQFRATYQPPEDKSEQLRPLPIIKSRKLRAGIGGKPSHKPRNSSSDDHANSSSVVDQRNSSSSGQRNSSSDYKESTYAVKDLYPDAVAEQPLPQRPNIFKLHEDLTGSLPQLIIDDLKDAAKEFPAEWLEAAFKEAAESNGRSWKYVREILKRWQREGFKAPRRSSTTQAQPAAVSTATVPSTSVGAPRIRRETHV